MSGLRTERCQSCSYCGHLGLYPLLVFQGRSYCRRCYYQEPKRLAQHMPPLQWEPVGRMREAWDRVDDWLWATKARLSVP